VRFKNVRWAIIVYFTLLLIDSSDSQFLPLFSSALLSSSTFPHPCPFLTCPSAIGLSGKYSFFFVDSRDSFRGRNSSSNADMCSRPAGREVGRERERVKRGWGGEEKGEREVEREKERGWERERERERERKREIDRETGLVIIHSRAKRRMQVPGPT
jgi:hypothetical protein